jgi:ATP-dependent DNA helicase DinG
LATRFTTAFPPGIRVDRVGLVDAIDMVKDFAPRGR